MQRIDENLLREQLDPWEFALTLQDLAEMMGSQRLAAARMAKTEDWYSVQISPLKCPQWEKEIREGTFTPTHARALTRWASYPAIVTGCRREWDIRTAEPWSAPEAALVAEKLGIDFAAEWNRETDIDEAARCYDMTPDQLRKIRGRYLPGLRPQDLPALLK